MAIFMQEHLILVAKRTLGAPKRFSISLQVHVLKAFSMYAAACFGNRKSHVQIMSPRF